VSPRKWCYENFYSCNQLLKSFNSLVVNILQVPYYLPYFPVTTQVFWIKMKVIFKWVDSNLKMSKLECYSRVIVEVVEKVPYYPEISRKCREESGIGIN
jgi:hypothetical protein